MTSESVRKFTFDTVFDEDGGVVRAPVRKYTYKADEVETVRQEAFAQGQASDVAEAERRAAAALEAIAAGVQTVRETLAAERARLTQEAVAFAMAGAEAAAGAALKRFPDEAVAGLFDACLEMLRDAPQVTIRVAPDCADAVAKRIAEAAAAAGFEAGVEVTADADITTGDAELVWTEGAITTNAQETFERVRALAERWLAADAATSKGEA